MRFDVTGPRSNYWGKNYNAGHWGPWYCANAEPGGGTV
jgi:hypothetical protein